MAQRQGPRTATRVEPQAIIALLLVWFAIGRHAEELFPQSSQVQRDVHQIARALYRGDVDTVLRFTHPTIIRLMGGRTAARAAIEQAVRQFSGLGMKLESFSFPRPPEFLEGRGRHFAIVPTLSIISANGQIFESLNFQLGVRDPGTRTWKYVEGSRVDEANVRRLFPEFPRAYKFPRIYRKKLEK